MEKKNYNAIDVAKFISALLVVGIHTGPFLDINKEANFILIQIIARLAVPLFFVASGFLLFRKLDLTREWNDYDNIQKIKQYLKRLVKLYIIWSILYLPFNYLLLKGGDGLQAASILRYIRDFFFTGSYYHLWFLPALLLAVPLSYLLIARLGYKVALVIGCILYLLGMAGNVYPTLLEQIPAVKSVLSVYLSIFSTTRNGLFFGVIFVCIGAFFAKRRIYLRNYVIGIGLLLSLFLLFVECYSLRAHGFMKDLTSMYLMLIPCVSLLFLLLLRIHIKDSPVYRTMRILSLLIYVSHLMFVNIILWAFPQMNSLAVYLITVLSSVVISYLLCLVSKKIPILKHLY